MRLQNNFAAGAGAVAGWQRLKGGITLGLLLGLGMAAPWSWAEDPGITSNTIRIGATFPPRGRFQSLRSSDATRNGCSAGRANGA